jgi:hypothetical protein
MVPKLSYGNISLSGSGISCRARTLFDLQIEVMLYIGSALKATRFSLRGSISAWPHSSSPRLQKINTALTNQIFGFVVCTAEGTRHADHVATSIRKMWH